MNKDEAKDLIERYNKGLASAEERAWIDNWFLHESGRQELASQEVDFLHLKHEIWMGTLQKLGSGVQPKLKPVWTWLSIAAAAVIVITAGLSLYFYKSGAETGRNHTAKADVGPGGNRAILTLANGQQIVLNAAVKGEISRQAGISVRKSKEGELIYTVAAGEEKLTGDMQHTISTPKGGQYTVVLADGTKVMLNAASSFTFPASFKGKDRLVELIGEAYFEVAKHKNSRFRVVSGAQTVEVLGTHFNLNAYGDEQTIKTTLLEGSVKVSTPKKSVIIVPGEQTVLERGDAGAIFKQQVNTGKETAWANGVFSFEGDDLRSVMRQIARWYDVEVLYPGTISNEKYFGEISRNSKLSEVFKILELNDIKFDIEGKTVKVWSNQRRPAAANP